MYKVVATLETVNAPALTEQFSTMKGALAEYNTYMPRKNSGWTVEEVTAPKYRYAKIYNHNGKLIHTVTLVGF